MSGEPKIELTGVGKTYGDTTVLAGVELTVRESEIVCLVGPSGCGKTTVLNMIAGFDRPDTGDVRVSGRSVAKPGPDRTVVFQQESLFPWLTSMENVLFGLPSATAKQARGKAAELLERLHLGGFENRYPYQLSGGMKQRVSIARALVRDPDVILMDEPFGALDAQTRVEMQELLQVVWLDYKPTILFITHDIEEACLLGDRVLVMSRRPGTVSQELVLPFERPRSYRDLMTNELFNDVKTRALDAIHGKAAPLAHG